MTTIQILIPLALVLLVISAVVQILIGHYRLGAFLIFITFLGGFQFYFEVWGNR